MDLITILGVAAVLYLTHLVFTSRTGRELGKVSQGLAETAVNTVSVFTEKSRVKQSEIAFELAKEVASKELMDAKTLRKIVDKTSKVDVDEFISKYGKAVEE